MACCFFAMLLAAAGTGRHRPPPPPPPPAPPIIVFFLPPPEYVPALDGAAAPLPPPVRLSESVRAMIDAAIASGDQRAIAAVLRFARATDAGARNQIDALDAKQKARAAERNALAARERAEMLANAAFLDNWRGEIELGGSRATGSTDNLGLYGAAKLSKEGLRWRHNVLGRIDYQRTDGVTSTERAIAAWQPNFKLDDKLYAFGLGQYERDRFLGYSSRVTLGTGIGYRVVGRPELRIDFEGGPAVRHTVYVEEPTETTVAGRASLAIVLRLSPTLQFTQNAAVYLEAGNNNATSTTALDTKLIGALKARLSYNVTYEKDAPAGRDSLDTLSRATLVYGF